MKQFGHFLAGAGSGSAPRITGFGFRWTRASRLGTTVALVCLIATGAFWAVLFKDPAKSVAGGAFTGASQVFAPLALPIPAGLATDAWDAH
jgi:hypothetical protein